jgi:hypothetical protein
MRINISTWKISIQRRSISSLRSTKALPDHIMPLLRQHRQSSSSPPPSFPFLVPELVPPPPAYEEMSPAGKVFKLAWPTDPRNILIVKKRRDPKVTESAVKFAKFAISVTSADLDTSTTSTRLTSLLSLESPTRWRASFHLYIPHLKTVNLSASGLM